MPSDTTFAARPGVGNVIRSALDRDLPTLGTHLSLQSPMVVETIGRTGVYDYVEMIVEYGTYDINTLENVARAAELYGMGTMIKVHGNDGLLAAQRAVGAGFDSVLFAEPRSVDDVTRCVQAVRPDSPVDGGLAGVGARRYVQTGYFTAQDMVDRLRTVVVAIMIEKPSSLEVVEDIAKVPGVDMIVFGPADYSIAIGRPGDSTCVEVLEAGRRVVQACLSAGVRFRAEVESVDEVQYFLDLGVRDFCLGGDLRVLYATLKNSAEQLRELLDRSKAALNTAEVS